MPEYTYVLSAARAAADLVRFLCCLVLEYVLFLVAVDDVVAIDGFGIDFGVGFVTGVTLTALEVVAEIEDEENNSEEFGLMFIGVAVAG